MPNYLSRSKKSSTGLDEPVKPKFTRLEIRQPLLIFSGFCPILNLQGCKPNFECKRPYLNLIRGILRKQKYKFESSDYLVKLENGLLKRSTKYKIFRDK